MKIKTIQHLLTTVLIGKCYHHAGQKEKAIDCYQFVLEYGNTSCYVEYARSELHKLQEVA